MMQFDLKATPQVVNLAGPCNFLLQICIFPTYLAGFNLFCMYIWVIVRGKKNDTLTTREKPLD